MFSTQQEDGHLGTSDRTIRAVIAATAAGGDSLGSELFDPGSRETIGGDIRKDGASGSRRRIAGAMNATQQEDRHLSTSDRVSGTGIERGYGAATGDAGSVDRLDLRPAKTVQWNICEGGGGKQLFKSTDVTMGTIRTCDSIL